MKQVYSKARAFIYRHARPLDFARFQYLFEHGSKDAVIMALTIYQNDDSGFGHCLEPDNFNPNSSPISTWVATEIIEEIGGLEPHHPLIQGILDYLSDCEHFDGHYYAFTIPSNNDYPHAPWWSYSEDAPKTYNPTACLAGFIVKYADPKSSFYQVGVRLVKEAFDFLKSNAPIDSMHTLFCFLRLYEYLVDSNPHLVDMDEYAKLLSKNVTHCLEKDPSQWLTGYVCKPSRFISSTSSMFYAEHKVLADEECNFIINTQEQDGSWAVPWSWDSYPSEWAIAKLFWQSDLIIKNLSYLRGIKGLEEDYHE